MTIRILITVHGLVYLPAPEKTAINMLLAQHPTAIPAN